MLAFRTADLGLSPSKDFPDFFVDNFLLTEISASALPAPTSGFSPSISILVQLAKSALHYPSFFLLRVQVATKKTIGLAISFSVCL